MHSNNIRTLQDTLEDEFRRWLDRLPCYMSTDDYDKWLEAVREDMRAIMEHWPREQTLVSPSDYEMILDLIENPPEPTEKLKQMSKEVGDG